MWLMTYFFSLVRSCVVVVRCWSGIQLLLEPTYQKLADKSRGVKTRRTRSLGRTREPGKTISIAYCFSYESSMKWQNTCNTHLLHVVQKIVFTLCFGNLNNPNPFQCTWPACVLSSRSWNSCKINLQVSMPYFGRAEPYVLWRSMIDSCVCPQ